MIKCVFVSKPKTKARGCFDSCLEGLLNAIKKTIAEKTSFCIATFDSGFKKASKTKPCLHYRAK